MSSANGVVTQERSTEEEVATDPYELARKSAEADQTREQERTAFFRRQNIFQYVIIALLSAAVLVLCFKHFVEVKVVYDHGGALADGGTASALSLPTDDNVAFALADYVTCLRAVSNDDLRLDECKSLVTDIMTQNLSPAHARDDVEAWYSRNNPKWLQREETRTVLNDRDHPFTARRIGGNSYYVHWFEKLHSFEHGDTYHDHSGTLVIAPPFIPTDDTMRHLDPAGVVVISSDGVLL